MPAPTPTPSASASASAIRRHSSLPRRSRFFGRLKELEQIAEAIQPEARTWGALIDGPGGIGKTALAVEAAYQAPSADFDRIIFLSAKVRELTPAGEQPLEDFMLPNYMALVTELGRELGDDTIERTAPETRVSDVRRALADIRALIVIDNVETLPEDERVRLYLFLSRLPGGCKAIVTSRRRNGIDARTIRLDRLERQGALGLIADMAKNNRHLARATDQELADLYEITNGSPLLIEWSVGQLGREGSRCRTISEACSFLAAAPRGNDPLEYIFGDLLDTFTESETAALATLTHFTQPATTAWIADIAGVTEPAALTALEDLTDRALLIIDDESQAYLLPPLAATFLRRKCPEIVIQTGVRLTDHVLTLVLENGWNNYDRFSTITTEWSVVAASLPLLLQGTNDRLQVVCEGLRFFLEFSGRWDERLALFQQAEEIALASDDRYNAGWRAIDTGWVHASHGRSSDALKCAERAIAHWSTLPQATSREEAVALHLKGDSYRLGEAYTEALDAYRESLKLLRGIAPGSGDIAIVLNAIAGIERKQGDYDSAEQNFDSALQIAKKTDDRQGIAIYTGNLANLALVREDWVRAEQLTREALVGHLARW